ncbi:MAG: hypothetical protein AAF694_11595 [Bacteroidota bacterium]
MKKISSFLVILLILPVLLISKTELHLKSYPVAQYTPSAEDLSREGGNPNSMMQTGALAIGPMNIDSNLEEEAVVIDARLGVIVLLEGFLDFGTTGMHTRLNAAGVIPQAQPFNTPPFEYSGQEQLGFIPPFMTDWILVELWDSTTNEVIARKAAILSNFGLVLDVDGQPGVFFQDVPDQGYLIAIRARGHLPILSSQTHRLSPATEELSVYDFSLAVEQARGNEQMKRTLAGFVLYAGDYNGDGIINNLDYNLWAQNASALNAYLPVDGDGNAIINNLDFNLWTSNGSKIGDPLLVNP